MLGIRRSHRGTAAPLLALASLFVTLAGHAADVAVTPIVHTGAPMPGLPAGVTTVGLSTTGWSGSPGEILVFASLAGVGVDASNDRALFVADIGGGITYVDREGSGLPGNPLDVGGRAWLLPSGDLLTKNDAGLWGGVPGEALAPLVSIGDAAAGMPLGSTFSIIETPQTNAASQVFFEATVVGGGVTTADDQGIWRAEPNGSLTLLVREGDPAPVYAGDYFRSFEQIAVDDLGGLAFVALLDSVDALYRASPNGTVSLLGRQGTPAPGPGSVNFASFSAPRMSPGTGRGAFWAALNGIAPAFYRFDENGVVTLLHWTGDPAPEIPEGYNISSAISELGFSAADRLWLYGVLTENGQFPPPGSIDRFALWSSDSGGPLELALREGLPVGPEPTYLVWYEIKGVTPNAASQVLVDATLIDGNGQIVGEDLRLVHKTTAHRLAGPGDAFEVAPGDVRVLDTLTVSMGLDEIGKSLSEDGSAVFHATFLGGGEGIFAAQAVDSVPAVGGLAGAITALGLLGAGVRSIRARR